MTGVYEIVENRNPSKSTQFPKDQKWLMHVTLQKINIYNFKMYDCKKNKIIVTITIIIALILIMKVK